MYYVHPKTGKQTQIPRKETAHLDGKPVDAVYAWIEKWEKEHGISRDRSRRELLKEDDKLTFLWRQYQEHRASTQKRRPRTAEKETLLFHNDIVSFFVGIYQKKDPTIWHDLIPDFHLHLRKRGLGDRSQQKILWTLERFGGYLLFQRRMTFPFVVQVPSRQNTKETPLKIKKTPQEIIKYVKNLDLDYKEIDFKLAVLLGYFAGLRPSELYGLSKEDFLTGKYAVEKTKTYEGFNKLKMGSKLSVKIYKTLGDYKNAEPEEMTKTDSSRSVVNIWDKEAAKMIAEILKDRPVGRLFNFSYGWLERAWREQIKPTLGVTPHDLRRASALYLGRSVRIPLTLLQEHMRHAEISTTMLYTREPTVEDLFGKSVQDFDDVA